MIDADPARRFVVVSACGRRHKADTKVTDLLYLVDAHVNYHVSCEDLLADIGQRYFDIADELGLSYPIREEFAAFAERARSGGYSTEELVSRGEYFTARLMAEYLDLPFIDAADMVAFHHDGTLSMSRAGQARQGERPRGEVDDARVLRRHQGGQGQAARPWRRGHLRLDPGPVPRGRPV